MRAGVEAEARRLALLGALLLGAAHPPHIVVRAAHRPCHMSDHASCERQALLLYDWEEETMETRSEGPSSKYLEVPGALSVRKRCNPQGIS